VLDTLTVLHDAQMAHGGLARVFVDPTDPSRVFLDDFARDRLTATPRQIVALDAAPAPELFRGEHATPATDVYLLGVWLYRMLTGRPPFDETDPLACALGHLTATPVPPSAWTESISPEVDRFVLSLLAKDPAGRPPDARAVLQLADALVAGSERTEGTYEARVERLLLASSNAPRGEPRGAVLAELGRLFADDLDDPEQALAAFARALVEVPGSDEVAAEIERLAASNESFWEEALSVLQDAAPALVPAERAPLLLRMSRWYEVKLAHAERAEQACKEGLAAAEDVGDTRTLVALLERQLPVATTPRQGKAVHERLASLYAEEFLDDARAARSLEALVALDPRSESFLTRLATHLRALQRWDSLERVLAQHAALVSDDTEYMALQLSRVRLLERERPEDALAVVEALVARVPRFGEGADNRAQRASLWTRTARLLESAGDRDGALVRYKKALEVDPGDVQALEGLKATYAAAGDTVNLVALLETELAQTQSKPAKAKLYASLARLRRGEPERAKDLVLQALALDPSNVEALLLRGHLAFDEGRMGEAARAYDAVLPYLGAISGPEAGPEAVETLVRFIEACAASPETAPVGKVATASELLFDTSDRTVLERLGRALVSLKNSAHAAVVLSRLLAQFGDAMTPGERAARLAELGEAQRILGEVDAARTALQEALELEPSQRDAYASLVRLHEDAGSWEELSRLARLRLGHVEGPERFEHLVALAELQLLRLEDRPGALDTLLTAHQARPTDRGVLTKLVELGTALEDWPTVVDAVGEFAALLEDPLQRAKYLQTAALVSWRSLGDLGRAARFLEEALGLDPSAGVEQALEVAQLRGDHETEERLLNRRLEQAKASGDRRAMVEGLDALGAFYAGPDRELALDAYEAAHAFDPENDARGATLVSLYSSDLATHWERAVTVQYERIRRHPEDPEGYRVLRRLYTQARRGDGAWRLCQALVVLGAADPDETRFYNDHRADNAAPVRRALDEDDWRLLAHADLDPLLTEIFARLVPVLLKTRASALDTHGYERRYALDLARLPYPMCQTLCYALGVLGVAVPPVFQAVGDVAEPGVMLLVARPPALVIGARGVGSRASTPSMAFVAGRLLAGLYPGFMASKLVPTGTGLRAWLFAAIRASVPAFPVAPELQGPVEEARGALAQAPASREALASPVAKLLQSGKAIDLKKWSNAVEATADRAGFLLAHDLATALEGGREPSEGAAERVKALLLFSVGEAYGALRERLGIAIEGGELSPLLRTTHRYGFANTSSRVLAPSTRVTH
jgi:tetratricopeptide (TPR) repeat protein